MRSKIITSSSVKTSQLYILLSILWHVVTRLFD